ncbi:MAG: holo-ACP synthase [Nitrospirota bacterium]
MMQIYQGVDLVGVAKFKDIFDRNKDFVSDIFTEAEREYCHSKKESHIHFAGRFAAKEACIKALGIGLSGAGIDHTFQEIEVTSHSSGKPLISINGWASKVAAKKGINQLTVSISHSSDYAVATVILVGN